MDERPCPAIFIVATPIGNLDDLTPRAQRTLKEADLIAAEDTRRTRQLLSHLGIRGKEVVSYQDHGEAARADQLIERLVASGGTLALVSDAGTPCVSDPGYRLVAKAKKAGIAVHPIPGPSALTTLVSASGLPSDRFTFIGFLPAKAGALREEIGSWQALGGAVVFFEPTRRLPATLRLVAEVYPAAQVAIGRELTKLHEEIATMAVMDAAAWADQHEAFKGEATVMVYPGEAVKAEVSPQELQRAARHAFANGASLKDLLRDYADAGYSRSELYTLLLAAKDEA